MIPLWVEIVAASLAAGIGLYRTISRAIRRHEDGLNVWRVNCYASSKGAYFDAVNGRWDRSFPRKNVYGGWDVPKGGFHSVAGPLDPADDDTMATARVATEERVAVLNAQKANYR